MQWKLSKGKFRPRLQAFVDDLAADDVKRVSTEAFKQLGKAGSVPSPTAAAAALVTITQFKGVGPATGSAVLSLYCPHVPFMGDEALEACLPKREYTPGAFKAYLGEARAWAARLAEQEQQSKQEHNMPLRDATHATQLQDCCWTPQLLQLALYARAGGVKLSGQGDPLLALAALQSMPAGGQQPAKGTKRPRAKSQSKAKAAPAVAAAAAAAGAAAGGGAGPSPRDLRAKRR